MVSERLLEILACPLGKAPVKLEGEFLVCTKCGAKYPIKDDIPVMLIDELVLPDGVKSVEELACYPKETT
jgi:hypothetical protein